MKVDKTFLDNLTAQAQMSPRKRMNFDLRDSADDQSQKMLNALEPATQVPVHRHREFSETVAILRGRAVQYFYDDSGVVIETVELASVTDRENCPDNGSSAVRTCPAVVVEKGRWHRIVSLESGTVILECKNGAFRPLAETDIMDI